MLNVSAKFEWDQIKDEEAALILIWTVLSSFDTQRSKDDVTMDLSITAFEILSQRTVMPSLVVIGQQVKEKRRGGVNVAITA